MSEIAPVTRFDRIDAEQECQEASDMSGHRYIACGEKAGAIVASDGRAYYMCVQHTMHNLRNRGAGIIYARDPELKRLMLAKSVKVVKAPDVRDAKL